MVALNAELARVAGWPAITRRKEPLPDADEWKDRTEKLVHLSR
jgi:ferredoxin